MREYVTIGAVGDIMPGDSFYCIGHGVRSVIEKKGDNFVFKKVENILKSFDMLIGNLECVISSVGEKKARLKSIQYRGNKSFAESLKEHGFSVLSIANNHIMQHGEKAMYDTVSSLRAVGIMPIGLPVIHQRTEPDRHMITIKGIDIAFISFCLNQEPFTKGIVPDIEDVIADIEFFAASADRLVVSLHWGTEYMNIPSRRQVTLARRMIDSGADIIIGHHPHVLQGIERYNDGIIAYSLGNFIFNAYVDTCRETMILRFNLTKTGPIEYQTVPIMINTSFQPFKPYRKQVTILENRIQHLTLQIKNHPVLVSDNQRSYCRMARKVLANFRKEHRKNVFKILPKMQPFIAAQVLAKPLVSRVNKFFRYVW
jgi:poly-gamma-glutamate synthesis protein (capsule biosynthesis protein)